MIPYYILKSDTFDTSLSNHSTSQQSCMDAYGDCEPSVKFNKLDKQIITGYTQYSLISESISKRKGRAYGHDYPFEQFISIDENFFYYNSYNQILIFKSSRSIFSNFTRAFKKDPLLKFEKIEVDFERVIGNANSIGVEGMWLGEIPDININALALLGSKVESSQKYKELKEQGAQISNLTIIYNFKDKQEKIMITKDGGIILYHHREETYALELVRDVYEKLFT